MHYEYKVCNLSLPWGMVGPIRTPEDMTVWLNKMDELEWELLGNAPKFQNWDPAQDWCVFRRARQLPELKAQTINRPSSIDNEG